MGQRGIRVLCGAAFAVWIAMPGAAHGYRDNHNQRGPLDIHRASVSQSRDRLSFAVSTAGRWSPVSLRPKPALVADATQTYLCLELAQRERKRRYCLTRKTKSSPVAMVGGPVNARGDVISFDRLRSVRVRRPNRHSARISFSYRAAHVRPGRLRWRLRSGWGDPVCHPDPELPEPKRREDGSPSCLDRAPNRSYYRARVIRPRIVGCTRDQDLFNHRGSSHGKRIALTFDDGPSSFTARVLNILNHNHAHGTFFVVGRNIPGRTDLLRRMRAGGHEIGNHSLHHETNGASSYSLRQTDQRIRSATGFEPCLYRPPGGYISTATSLIAWAMGMSNILWDIDPQDWRRPGASYIYNYVVSRAHAGSIVLLHDGGGERSGTVAALDNIIHTLKSRGFKLVTVTQILNERYRWVP